jgi:hypothetical protein
MTIIYDMENGSIQSEQGQKNSADNGSEAGPDVTLHTALQEFRTVEIPSPRASIHLIRALTGKN